jgi:hypothetical protein
MGFKKKQIVTVYKKFSKIYTQLKTEKLVKNKLYKIQSFDFLNQNSSITTLKYNLTIRKILESREYLFLNFKELNIFTKNKNNIKLLRQESKRKKLIFNINGNFSIFKEEVDSVSFDLKANINFNFDYKKKKNTKNLKQKKKSLNYSLSDFLPMFNEYGKFKISFDLYCFCSSRIFPTSLCSGKFLKIFKKLGVFRMDMDFFSPIKWTYQYGLILRCSIIYFILQSDLCEKIFLINLFPSILDFCFSCSIFIKSISLPIISFKTCPMKFFREIKNISYCKNYIKEKLNFQNYLNNLINRLLFLDGFSSKIKSLIINYFWKFIKKKLYNNKFFKKKKCKNDCFSYFFFFKAEKIADSYSIKNLFKIFENIEEIKGFKLILEYFLSENKESSVFHSNKITTVKIKKILVFLKKKLLSFKNNKSEKITAILKLGKKKSNFEIAINSGKKFIGLEVHLEIFFSIFIKISFSFIIKSQWQFYRVNISNKRANFFDNNTLSYPLVYIKCKKINLMFKTNFFKNKTEKISKKKTHYLIFYQELEISKNKIGIQTNKNHRLSFMISNYLYEVFFYSNSDDLSLIFFSVFRKIVKQNYHMRKIIIPVFFNRLLCWISKNINFLTFPKNFNSRFFDKLFKKKQIISINMEYYSIWINYNQNIKKIDW